MIRTGGRYVQDPRTGELRRAETITAPATPAAPPTLADEETPIMATEAEATTDPSTDAAKTAKKG